jgi:predicted Zn-dependent peptidase
MNFQETKLANGLTIIGEHNPQAKSLALGYFVRTGARDEVGAESGVSHFLEHMLFKGSENIGSDAINQTFDNIGAKSNAFTSEEVTCYYGAVLPEQQGKLAGLLSEMMQPALRQSDFDTEKGVILEEIQMYQDQPDIVLYDALRPMYYGNHPSGQSILGTLESVTALSRAQMLNYYRRRYAPNNLTLAVAGNYDWDALLSQITVLTKDWQAAEIGRVYPDHQPQSSSKEHNSEAFHQAYIGLMAPGVSIQDPRRYGADILAEIIGDDENSRLYWALVDSGLAETASLGHSPEDQTGHYSATLICDSEQAELVLAKAQAVLQDVQINGVTAQELSRFQRKLAVSTVLRGETPYGRLFPFALDYLDNREYVSLETTIERIMAVTLQDLHDLLALRPFDTTTVLSLRPIAAPA